MAPAPSQQLWAIFYKCISSFLREIHVKEHSDVSHRWQEVKDFMGNGNISCLMFITVCLCILVNPFVTSSAERCFIKSTSLTYWLTQKQCTTLPRVFWWSCVGLRLSGVFFFHRRQHQIPKPNKKLDGIKGTCVHVWRERANVKVFRLRRVPGNEAAP